MKFIKKMKKSVPKKRLNVKDVSAAKHVIQLNSLYQIKGGVVITEDVYGF